LTEFIGIFEKSAGLCHTIRSQNTENYDEK